jgi:hypothetical protein
MVTAFVRQDSVLFGLAVELYLRHRPGDDGRCSCCWGLVCRVGHHAAQVIAAAGVDPAFYDRPPRRPEATHWTQQPTAFLPADQSSYVSTDPPHQ